MAKLSLAVTFILLTLAACGRKDYPAYPSDAIPNPAHVPSRSDSIHYY
ncbi:MAG TPA: hypothetical protein VF194_10495 [Ferrovibrio sp.]